jgi:cell wall-associated NlpC family hydrolase
MTLREMILQEAQTWLRTPYHAQACLKGIGVDCGQFIIGVAKAVGVLPPHWHCETYHPTRHWHQRDDLMSRILEGCGCTPVAWEAKQPGDVLTFRVGLTVSHAAFLLAGGDVVHALVDRGVVRDPLRGALLALHDRAWAFPYAEE